MPIKRCQKNGKPGYKWWDEWYCYVYTPWKKKYRKRAKRKAKKQWQAIKAN